MIQKFRAHFFSPCGRRCPAGADEGRSAIRPAESSQAGVFLLPLREKVPRRGG